MEAENNKKLCKNCDYPMDSCHKFCTNCGQKDLNKKLSLKDFIEEFFANFYAFDSKVLTSLRYLLTKPGVMSREFVNGKRLKFVNPFRLLLSLAILLGLLITLSTFLEDLEANKIVKNDKKESNEKTENDRIKINFGNKKISINTKNNNDTKNEKDTIWINKKRNVFYSNNHIPKEKELNGIGEKWSFYKAILNDNPEIEFEEICKKYQYKYSYWNKKIFEKIKILENEGDFDTDEEFNSKMTSFLISSLPYFLFISLPFFTLLLYLFFYKAGYNFTENLIFTFYLFSTYILPIILITIISCYNPKSELFGYIFLFLFFYNWIYFYKSLKNFYVQKKSIIRIKFVILSFLMPVVLSLSIALIIIVSFLMS